MTTRTHYARIRPNRTSSERTKSGQVRYHLAAVQRMWDAGRGETDADIDKMGDHFEQVAAAWNKNLSVTADEFIFALCDVSDGIAPQVTNPTYDRIVQVAQSLANHTGIPCDVISGRGGFAIAPVTR